MFTYFLLGIVLLVAIYFIARWFASTNPTTLAKWLKWTFLGLGGAATVYFAVTGKIGLALIPLALTVLPRFLSLFMQGARSGGRPSTGQSSEVETQYLRMTLEHDTGAMYGLVLQGRFAGRELSELSERQLLDLLSECRVNDDQSARLLESYLDRTFGTDWRQDYASDTSSRGRSYDAGRQAQDTRSSKMSKEEAYDVLGLKPGATPEDIHEAHRKLMLKLHPDQGGSNYLAAKINQAKDVLLGAR